MPRLATVESRSDADFLKSAGGLRDLTSFPFVKVNRREMMAATRMGYKNPYTTNCLQMLMSSCFAGGMQVRRANGEEITDRIRDQFTGLWGPLLQDAYLHMFMYGFCIIRRPVDDSPCAILNPLDYDVDIRTIDGLVVYRVNRIQGRAFDADALQPRPLTNIFVFELRPPFSNGGLRSHFASILESHDQLAVINASAMQTWMNGPTPTVLTGTRFQDTDQVERARDYERLGDQTAAMINARSGYNDVHEFAASNQRLKHVTNASVAPPVISSGVSCIEGMQTGATIVALPVNSTVEHVLPSGTPPDVQGFMMYVGVQVALMFGIPPMWELSARQASSNDTIDSMMYAAFRTAVAILREVANVVIADALRGDSFTDFVESYEPGMEFVDHAKKFKIDTSFPGVVTLDKISRLNMLGLLSHENLVTLTSDFMGIDPSRFSSEPYDPALGMTVRERIAREDAAATAALAASSSSSSSSAAASRGRDPVRASEGTDRLAGSSGEEAPNAKKQRR